VELLDVFHWPRRDTIVAELWRPSSLSGVRRSGGPDEGADRRRVWHHVADRDGRELSAEIITALARWLSA
jgi:hypothetical protein